MKSKYKSIRMFSYQTFYRHLFCLVALALHIPLFSQDVRQDRDEKTTDFHFQILAGLNLMQPAEFVGTEEITGKLWAPGYSFGVGLLYDINDRFSISSRFMYFNSNYRFDHNIRFDEDSYVYQNFGLAEFKSPKGGPGPDGFELTGYELGLDLQYYLVKQGRHRLGPALGVNILSAYLPILSSNVVLRDDNEPYQVFSASFENTGRVTRVGADLGIQYRYALPKGRSITADLRAHLYFGQTEGEADWSIWGKTADPEQFISGKIEYNYDRFSVNVGFGF